MAASYRAFGSERGRPPLALVADGGANRRADAERTAVLPAPPEPPAPLPAPAAPAPAAPPGRLVLPSTCQPPRLPPALLADGRADAELTALLQE